MTRPNIWQPQSVPWTPDTELFWHGSVCPAISSWDLEQKSAKFLGAGEEDFRAPFMYACLTPSHTAHPSPGRINDLPLSLHLAYAGGGRADLPLLRITIPLGRSPHLTIHWGPATGNISTAPEELRLCGSFSGPSKRLRTHSRVRVEDVPKVG